MRTNKPSFTSRFVGLVALCWGAWLMIASTGALAAVSRIQNGEQLRVELLTTVDRAASLLGRAPVHVELLRQLSEVRTALEQAPTSEFETLAPQLGTQILAMNGALADVEIQLLLQSAGEPATASLVSSTGYPSADYPDVDWDFLIEAASESPDDDAASAGDGNVCSLANAPGPNLQYSLLNLSLITEALRDTARRICDQIAQVLGVGANVAIACIATDILFLVERGILDNQILCSDIIRAAEANGTYERIDHLHTDLGNLESNLTTLVGTVQTNVTNQIGTVETNLSSALTAGETSVTGELDQNEAALQDLDADLVSHDLHLNLLADQIDGQLGEQAVLLANFRDQNLRLRIEARLAKNDVQAILRFLLPASGNGFLDLVRDIVTETIASTLAAGQGVGNALSVLVRADAALANGDFLDAYGLYGHAYLAAVR